MFLNRKASAGACLALIIAMSLSACGGNVTKTIGTQEAAQLAARGQVKEAADEYARIGEILLPTAPQYADEMFDRALQIDPTHSKANFYGAISRVLMSGKGFATRFESIVNTDQLRRLEQMKRDVRDTKIPELANFIEQLPAGKQAFGSYYDLQRALRTEALPALEEAQKRLARIDTSVPIELTIDLSRLSPSYWPSSESYSYEYSYCSRSEYNGQTGWVCRETVTERYSYYFMIPGGPKSFAVDSSDLEVVKSAFKGMTDFVRLSTAYSVKDLELFAKSYASYERFFGYVPVVQAVRLARQFSDLGKLMPDHQLDLVVASSADTIEHLLSLNSMRSQLCGNAARRNANRIFEDICFSTDDLGRLQLVADLLAGPKKLDIGSSDGEQLSVLVNLPGFMKHPPADLKDLLPTGVAGNGAPVVSDPTFDGLFPNGDAIEKLHRAGIIHFEPGHETR